MILLTFVPLLGLLAFAAAIWTAIDAAKRGQHWFAWSVAVAVTGVAGGITGAGGGGSGSRLVSVSLPDTGPAHVVPE